LKRRKIVLAAVAAGLLTTISGCGDKKADAARAGDAAGGGEKIRIAMVVKSLGNGFFDAAHNGANDAAKELKNVEIIYTGPTTPSAEGQIEIINSLISQKVDAIIISANDPNALVPIAKKAMGRGIKVLSFDSGLAKEGRLMQLNPSNAELIGQKQIQMASDAVGGKGEIAILSASAQATNQNIWIGIMKETLAKPEYAGMKLVATVYGDDQSDKSYREAVGLLRSNPDLKAIISPSTVGINAASKAVVDEKLVGKVYVTGLGLPSEMAGHVKSGAVREFAIWNPIDLGYAATYAAYDFVKGQATAKPGGSVSAGRMGSIAIDANGEGAMAAPFVYDKGNVDKFSKIF
jgi:rhamnose transport system substrate-binding protein